MQHLSKQPKNKIKVNFLSNKGFNTGKNYEHHVIKPYKQNNIKNITIHSLIIHKDIKYLRVKGEDLLFPFSSSQHCPVCVEWKQSLPKKSL